MKNNVQVLSGDWKIVRDPKNVGKAEKWFEKQAPNDASSIQVPGIIQMTFPDYHGVVWYWHSFTPEVDTDRGRSILLKLSNVDYYGEIWINGKYVGYHEGPEMPFEFDIAELINKNEENLLTVRVINPTEEPIDGIALAETPHINKMPAGVRPGWSFNFGGIMYRVELESVPSVRISDLFIEPDWKTGAVRITTCTDNKTGLACNGALQISVTSGSRGQLLTAAEESIWISSGEDRLVSSVSVTNPHLWSVDDPYLYGIQVAINTYVNGETISDVYSISFGFRDFRVENGFFRLNGKRIFIRSTLTGNHMPGSVKVPLDPALIRKDLIYAKANGFNMIRFLCGVALPEQLDFCDEIGLLVYEECNSSWFLKDSPRMAEWFDEPTLGMIRRDRNHPSVTIWGLLNETRDGPTYRHAVTLLPGIRELDETRLVLLSSGRWDQQLRTGSVSNPGSRKWEFQWGGEAPDAGEHHEVPYEPWDAGLPGGLYDEMGDLHCYPLIPRPEQIDHYIRSLGQGKKPVFLSEAGISSLFDVIRTTRYFEQKGDLNWHDAAFFRSVANLLETDWKRYGMEGLYPFLEDMIRDSYRLQTKQRSIFFDLVRSNPKFCGYSITGMLDHGYCGEGLWTFFREWKPGISDVLQEGWSPLRWCLFVEPKHVYANSPVKVEAVLANEDALRPGDYPVSLKISGTDGMIWESQATARVPKPADGKDGPLAIPVFSDEITLDAKAGDYVFSVCMLKGGAPAGGRLPFHISKLEDLPPLSKAVTLWGLDDVTEEWFQEHNICYNQFCDSDPDQKSLILAGKFTGSTEEDWDKLLKKVSSGSTVVFLSPHAFERGEDSTGWIPFKNKGRCYKFINWNYHMECIAKRHPYFEGMQGEGMLDYEYYGQTIPDFIFDGLNMPDEVVAAGFAVCYPEKGYSSTVLLGEYNYFAGRVILNTFHIEENLGLNPAADQLLMNIIKTEEQKLQI